MQKDIPFITTLSEKARSVVLSFFEKKPKRFLSIDFGRAFVKIAYMERLGENLTLLNYDIKKILSSELNRRDAIEFISNFLKTNSVFEKEVYLTISDPDSVIIKGLDLPAMPQKEVLQAAKLELQDDISFTLEDALVDWQVVRNYQDEDGAAKNKMIFILADARTVDKYLSIVDDCSLNPVMISSEPFNYAHILRYIKNTVSVCALLDIGHQYTNLCIYHNNKLIFFRSLSFSSAKLTQSLTTSLTSDTGRWELSSEKAENIKQVFGIPQDPNQVLEGNIQPMQLISLIRPLLEKLVRELKRSFGYFAVNFQEESPSILYITGGGANLKNLDKYLSRELNIHVSELPLPDCIGRNKVAQEGLTRDKNQIINTLAAGLKDVQAINLLPQKLRTRKITFIKKISLEFIVVTIWTMLLFSLFMVRLQIRDYQSRLINSQIHLRTISKIKALKQKVDLREGLLDKILMGSVPVNGLLKMLSSIVPNDIILGELILDRDRGNLILKGTVSTHKDMAEFVLTKFMERLEASSFFTEASLLSSKRIGQVQSFEIKCDLPL